MLHPSGPDLVVFRSGAGDDDTHGNAVLTIVEHHRVKTFMVAPQHRSTEPVESGRQAVVIPRTAYVKPGQQPIQATDEVTVDGETLRYRVIGEPSVWPNPWSGGEVGAVVELERVSG